jgi:ubiquitin carboxyl-terminal hydrolase 34
MKKEKRLDKKTGEEEEEQEEKKVEDEDNQVPEEENCFEYKLVGVVVHSGTANAGHYWSYINTKRGFNETDENDPNWSKTEGDPWMEFNDSTVRDFNFEKLKEECYGGDGKSGNDESWSFGSSYGKSAYMLVYERK